MKNPAKPHQSGGLCLVLWLALLFAPAAFCQSSQVCQVCHGNKSLAMNKGGRQVSLYVDEAKLKNSTHASMTCVNCHVGLNPAAIPHAKVIRRVQCSTCHEADGFKSSIHANITGCTPCHGTHDVRPVKDPKSQASPTSVSATCGQCHSEAFRLFSDSAHKGALASASSSAPNCVGCHGAHNVLPESNPQSPVYQPNEAKLCLKCHLENPQIREQVGYSAAFIAGYGRSAHALALASGNHNAATCSDCHGSHDLKAAGNPDSWVNKRNIAKTCSPCHQEISKVYGESIHGTAVLKGNLDSPTCTNCHGEHEIFSPDDPRAMVAPGNVSRQVCAACHNSVRLTEKYGMSAGQVASFEDSYHGLASRAGSIEVANCASCHGVHNIKPSSDPTSTVHKSNLAKTCGQEGCHPGAGENFARGPVHVAIDMKAGSPILYWIRYVYITLIIVVIGLMFSHNLLHFIKKTMHRIAVREGRAAPEFHGSAQYIRMTLNDRIQHALTLTSFTTLVITGFMLKYPDAWWVVAIRGISEEYFAVRGVLHRVAGAVLIGVGVYHLLFLFLAKRGRRFFRDMFPRLKDVKDVGKNVKYLTGLSTQRPLFDRFGYVEKTEYWALVWGTVIMGVTGIAMWSENFFIERFTKLGWDISRTIHFWEAWLATLAIVVWHFYYVMLNPDVYPMSTTWINGKISEREMAEEHPLELERIKKEEEA